MAGLSQARFLVNAHESLGLPYDKVLDSSISLIEAMLQEYVYIQREKSKALNRGSDEDGKDYEWVELPSFDDPSKTIRYKKYNDIGGKIRTNV